MARKLNKMLVGLLTLSGMVVLAAIGIAMVMNLPSQDPKKYEEEAQKYEAEGDYNRATQAYKRAFVKSGQTEFEYLVMAARCAREDGNLAEAYGALQTALTRSQGLASALRLSTELNFELAKLSGDRKYWTDLLETAKKLAEVEKESPLAHHAMGAAYLSLRTTDDSYEELGDTHLKRALELDPTNADIVKDLVVQSLATANQKEEVGQKTEAEALQASAEAILDAAIAKVESSETAEQAADLKILKARRLIDKGEREAGVQLLQQLAEAEQSRADAHAVLVEIYAFPAPGQAQPDYAKAAATAEAGLAVAPKTAQLYELLGRVYQLDRKPEQAEEVYRRALDSLPRRDHYRAQRDNNARVDFITQLFMMALGRVAQASDEAGRAEALTAAEDWISALKKEVNEKELPVLYMNAQLYKAKGDIVAATLEAETANRIVTAERHFMLQALLAELYMRQQAWGAAKKAILSALNVQPGVPVMWTWLAIVYLETGEPAEALAILKPASPGPLRDHLLQSAEAAKLRIRAYEELKQFDEAAREKQALPPELAEAPLFQAERLSKQGKDAEAEEILREALAKAPGDQDVLVALVRRYAVTDRQEKARALLEAQLLKDPENQLLRGMLLSLGTGDAANDAQLIEWIKTDEDDFRRAMRLAEFYRRRQNREEEGKQLNEAERLRPDDPGVIEQQLSLATQVRDWTRAEKYVARCAQLNIFGTEGKLPAGQLALARAAAYEEEQKPDQAKIEIERAIELIRGGLEKYPTYSVGWTFLAEAYMKARRIDEAKAALQRALDVDPTNGLAYRGLTLIAMYQKNQADEDYYRARAEKFLPNDPWVKRQSEIAREKENPKEGIVRREIVRREDPKNVENLIYLAQLYGSPGVAEYDRACEVYREALALAREDLDLARTFASFLGSEEVNRPAEGEELLKSLVSAAESDPPKKAALLVYLARFYEEQKQLATADRHIRLAVSVDPSVRTLLEAAEFCTRSNRPRDALEYYERALKQMESDSDSAKSTCARMIGLLLAQGDLEAAKEKIDSYMRQWPDEPQGLVFEGAWHRMGGDIQKAKAKFDDYLIRHPDSALVLWQRGQLYILMERWQSAIADLKNARVNSPDGFGYQHRISLANCLMEVGQDGEAISELTSIVKEHPEEQAVAEALVDLYLRARPPRYADAESLIIGHMRKRPNEVRWPIRLGQLARQSGDTKKAVESFEAAAKVARYRQGTTRSLFAAYRAANRPRDLIRCADEAVPPEVLRAEAEALVHLAWAYSQTGVEKKCFETYDQALVAAKDFRMQNMVVSEMSAVFGKEAVLGRCESRAKSEPENIGNLQVYAHLLFMTGRVEEALQTCIRIGELAVKEEDRVFAALAQGMLLDGLKRHSEAKVKYEEVLKINPQQSTALNNLAYLLVERMDNAAEALPYARQAYRQNPDDPGVLDTLGWTLAKNGQWGEAAGMLLRAIEIDRQNVAALYHLGLVYQARGEPEEAQQRLSAAKKAAEAQGDKGLLPKIEEALSELEKAGG